MIANLLKGLLFLFMTAGISSLAYSNEPIRPNVILVMADDQGWGETGYHGHPQLKTPILDEMAQSGLRLDRFYSAHVNCSPTRTSILTGRHPIRSGVFGPNWSTRPEEITVAQLLKKAGYRTGHFGKWHVGAVKAASPTNPNKMGFDEYLSHDNFFELSPMLSRNGADPTIVQGESSQVVVDAAIEFIRKSNQTNQPFFTLVWFGSPHAPYSGLPEDVAKYESIENEALKNRLTEISAMDRAIGVLRKSLRELKIAENTIVWFCSDNGLGHDPKSSFNGPWRDKKGSIFEGGLRVPGIIEWPNMIKSPRTSNVPCVTTDMMPTLMDLLELNTMLPKRPLDGLSIKQLIVGGDFAERPKPIGFWKYASAGEQNNERWMSKELTRGTTPTVNNPAIDFLNYRHPVERTDLDGDAAWSGNQYKLVMRGKQRERKAELYDLLSDPGEKVDIADRHPDVCNRMLAELVAWQRSVEKSLTGADYP
ncbi:MAG: sulfatase-like hydrolase/transferase [Pirellula sp.]